ncbi:MAG: glycerophosphodiester phosphodiesterase [Betaproteobacteria bacterium]|nr:MAG: glycerophosphodiester phosphodiesterase [Betaproteobacteria bacterium]
MAAAIRRLPNNKGPSVNIDRSLAVIAALGVTLLAGCATTGFDVQGHRGARGLAPENTLAAFDTAMTLGVTTLELDVGITKDGVVVVHHDRTLNTDIARDAAGAWIDTKGIAVSSLTLAELKRFDVGRLRPNSNYGKPFETQVPRDGERIPTLREVFDRVNARGGSHIRFNIETKLAPDAPNETLAPEPFVRALIAEIRRAKLTDRSTIQSFDWRTLRVAEREAPEIATVYLTTQQGAGDRVQAGKPGKSPWLAGFDVDDHGGSVPALLAAIGARVWSPNARDLTEANIKEAKALKLSIVPWTVNEEADMQRLIEAGVNGIITDYPDRLRRVMAAKQLPLPPAVKP